MPLKVTVNGDYSAFYYILYPYELTDTEMYPDEQFYDQLEYDGISRLSTNLIVKYDTPMTLVALAYDNQNNPTQLDRIPLRFTQDGASPAKDFIASSGQKSIAQFSSMSLSFNTPVGVKRLPQERITSEQMEAKHQEAMAKVEQLRKDKVVAKFEAAKMRKIKQIAK